MNSNNGYQNQWDFLDILNILSFILAIENLSENRQQSAHNDVQKANDKQANYLLNEVKSLFEEQNKMLEAIIEKLNALN